MAVPIAKQLDLEPHQELIVHLEDRRDLHVFVSHVGDHTSVDIWTTDKVPAVEPISALTGDTSRAATGLFGFRNGQRCTVTGNGEFMEHGWPAVGTVVLIWDTPDSKESA